MQKGLQNFVCLLQFAISGICTGGEQEAQSAYEEALKAVFTLQLSWRHMQPHRSRSDGKTKWSMIEMWPMHVSKAVKAVLPS